MIVLILFLLDENGMDPNVPGFKHSWNLLVSLMSTPDLVKRPLRPLSVALGLSSSGILQAIP